VRRGTVPATRRKMLGASYGMLMPICGNAYTAYSGGSLVELIARLAGLVIVAGRSELRL